MPSVRNVILASAAASIAVAETIIVKVGEPALKFDPQMVTANVGDIVEFQFWPQNHSVVAGDMETGCSPLADGGFFSGFMPVASGRGEQAFQVTIENTDPWVFYCSRARHCQGGMYGMINGDDTALQAYGALVSSAEDNVSPADDSQPFGGVVAAVSEAQTTGDANPTETNSETAATTTGGPETTETADPDSGAASMAASLGMGVAAVAAAAFLL